MKQALVALVIAGIFTPPAAAADRPVRVAILELETGQVDGAVVGALSSAVAQEIARRPGFEVITRGDVKGFLSLEATQSLLGCQGDACYGELGQILDVDRLVSGTLVPLGEGYFVGLSLIDARSARVESRSTLRAASADALVEGAPSLVSELLSEPARLALTHQVSGARVFVDDALVGVMPLDPIPLHARGRVAVRVERADYPAWSAPAELTPGRTTRLRLDMRSNAELEARSRGRRAWGVATGLASLAALGGGAWLTVRGFALYDDYAAVPLRGADQRTLDGLAARSRDTLVGGYVALGVGAALLGTSLTLLLHDPWAARLEAGAGGGLAVRF